MSIVLASASPQRKSLLEGLGIEFTVDPSSVDEAACTEQDPVKRAMLLAELKAKDRAAVHSDSLVIGCDTLVVSAAGELLEKPVDSADAERMLREHSGSVSTVHSGLCVVQGGTTVSDVSSSQVHFAELSEDEINWWVGTKQWQGRSGGFQIDGAGQLMIRHIEGDWTSIVGLPVFLLGTLCRDLGVTIAT